MINFRDYPYTRKYILYNLFKTKILSTQAPKILYLLCSY